MSRGLAIDRITDPAELASAALAVPPAGPGFGHADVGRAAVLLVESTTATWPGPDFTRWTLEDATGTTINTITLPGY